MPAKTLVDKIDKTDLTRTITNNNNRLYEVNQSTSAQQLIYKPVIRNKQQGRKPRSK